MSVLAPPFLRGCYKCKVPENGALRSYNVLKVSYVDITEKFILG